MNRLSLLHRILASASVFAVISYAPTPAAAAEDATNPNDEVIRLSEFQVTTSADKG